ncbi:hypothetical protein SAMN05880501_103115 [Ureibacillus xyleni]|uniref:Uncharacterized protein n=1 Tax=Ureibacillus xyleni TaxID=614648 RepID=A0A285S6E8_9BACL|nr:hypothetical protein [Ureibacillus xyleni]SOC02834.1 hypothetical protein SAMN05880501_103115 [Ureibacillus xyleni]
MNTQVLITNLNNWGSKLAEKEFQHFSQLEQKEIKKDYALAVEQARDYNDSTELVRVVKEFTNLVGNMEGFFFETVQ